MSNNVTYNANVYALTFNGSGSGLTTNTVPRNALALGTASQIVVNDSTGNLSTVSFITPSLGGTGINTSAATGIAKISAGVWSVSTILDADISSSAAISRAKLSTGVANQVVINNSSGVLSSEAQLAVSRGGLGADFSTVGAGPFVLSNASGTFSCNLTYSSSNVVNALVQRDTSGNIAVATVSANSLNASSITTTTGDLSIAPAGNNVNLGAKNIKLIPSSLTGGAATIATANVQTTNATATPLFAYNTASGTKGTAYHIVGYISLGDNTGGVNTAAISFQLRVKNIAGTLTVNSLVNKLLMADSGLTAVDVNASASSQTLQINVLGLASTIINWSGLFHITEQQF